MKLPRFPRIPAWGSRFGGWLTWASVEEKRLRLLRLGRVEIALTPGRLVITWGQAPEPPAEQDPQP